jgi:hypothetical protein
MSISHDFSKLSSAEIARLFHETRKLAIAQRNPHDQQERTAPATSGLHFVNGSYCSCDGGPGSHAVEPERYYQSEQGAMVRLEPGEERPASLEDERTARLCRMTENEVERLSEDARAELMEFREGVLEERSQQFRTARPKYHATEENKQALLERLGDEHLGYCLDDPEEMMSLLLTRGVWTVENLCTAFDALSNEGMLTPRPGDARRLDADELRTLSAYCSGCQTDSEFERVLDQYLYLATGNRKGWRAAALDARYSKVLEQAILFCFENSTPDYRPTAERRRFLKEHLAGRFPSVRLLRAGWELCKQAEAKGELGNDDSAPAPKFTEENRKLAQAQALADAISQESFRGL